MSTFFMRGLVTALVASASMTGCTEKPAGGGPHGAAKPIPITVAYVRLGEASLGGPQVDSPKWVLEEAGSAGLVIHSIGVWQELPKTEEYRLLVTNREIVNCRVVETREDGQVVFEASAHVSRSRKRLVLGPGAKERGFVHLSGQDAVAVRLGWEGQVPPPIFARALLVHTDSAGRRSWPANLPDWVVEVLKGPTFRATGCEDLDAGRWVELNADQRSLGRTAASGEVLARIDARDRNGWASVSAALSNSRKDERGRLLRRAATVQPVIPGNERPGTILTFEQAGEGSYIAVVLHYGAVDTAGPKARQVE